MSLAELLQNPTHMHQVLKNLPYLRLRCFSKGDYIACDYYLDFQQAIIASIQNPLHAYIYERYFISGYSQREIAIELGIRQQSVFKHIRRLVIRIVQAYQALEKEESS